MFNLQMFNVIKGAFGVRLGVRLEATGKSLGATINPSTIQSLRSVQTLKAGAAFDGRTVITAAIYAWTQSLIKSCVSACTRVTS